MKDAFIGIDLGTSSVKLALVDIDKVTRGRATRTYDLKVDKGGEAVQNPREWFDSVMDGMEELVANSSGLEIKGIGLTGQWSGTVPVDRDGEALGNAIIWMDTRGSDEIDSLTSGFPSLSGYRIDKLIRWLRKTGGAPTHSGKDSLAHILYIKHNLPELYEKTYKFLEPKDYIAAKLTGNFKASWDNIALLWSTDNRDPNDVRYDDRLLSMSGLLRGKLPEVIRSTDLVGPLKEDIGNRLGISDVKVVSGCGDIACSIIGAGCIEDYKSLIYMGTSSWITSHVPFKKTDLFHNIASLPSGIPGKYFIAAEQENACNCMEFVSGLMGISGADKYSIIENLVSNSQAGSNGLMFLPWLFGERAPIEDPYIRGGFYNLSLDNNKDDMVRSVMEGVALNSKWLLNTVEKFTGRKIEELHMSGGGALSNLRATIFSNVLGRKIRVVTDPRFSTVKGAAMIAAVGLEKARFSDLSDLGEPLVDYLPDKEENTVYEREFQQFIEYYKNNKKKNERE
ncbi:MAG: FGGY-family carbohydrate kinase [Thermoplasmatales archaeon]|nr:FGGY-family carbohydrate kinase [Candidatus Thermoplasmatota archaeon]MCL6003419.1 FGGY-family carbohydrate kinase [Candidatus Thermoplasmatota archaeon]MDA8056214.1 FGGY-family carbohydrate kinase [Thermoplasmatales archaeon]